LGIINDNPDVVKTYEVTLHQLKELVAKNLNVSPEEISIDDVKKDVSHPMDNHSNYAFDGIKVTHTPKKKG